jgi:hypothetical protein
LTLLRLELLRSCACVSTLFVPLLHLACICLRQRQRVRLLALIVVPIPTCTKPRVLRIRPSACSSGHTPFFLQHAQDSDLAIVAHPLLLTSPVTSLTTTGYGLRASNTWLGTGTRPGRAHGHLGDLKNRTWTRLKRSRTHSKTR